MESVILGLVGVVLSLVFKYVPAAQDWFDRQSNKGLFMLGLVALVSVGYFALSCLPFGADFGVTIACDQSSAVDLIKAFFVIAIGNQLAFLYTSGSRG